MAEVVCPVPGVGLGEGLVVDDEEVLGVGVLGRLREVETARHYRFAVHDHDFVVGDGMGSVNPDGDSGMLEEGQARIFFRPLAFVQDHADIEATAFRVTKSFSDRGGSEGIRLNNHGRFRVIYRIDNGIRTTAIGAEEYRNRGRGIGGWRG